MYQNKCHKQRCVIEPTESVYFEKGVIDARESMSKRVEDLALKTSFFAREIVEAVSKETEEQYKGFPFYSYIIFFYPK